MSRGKLDKNDSFRIEKGISNVNKVRIDTLNLSPEMISAGFPPKSQIPVAAVCLQDVTSTLEEVRYALLESLFHIFWFREKCEPKNEHLAVFFGKFYVDDTALRMFAVKEHLTSSIINMLGLSRNDLQNLRKTFKKVDDLTRIEKNLRIKFPNHPLINPISKLNNSKEWQAAKKYRNDWVHNKPPIIKGLGIEYERKNRLIVTQEAIGVTFGQGDDAHFSIDELILVIKSAFALLVKTTEDIVEYYFDYLSKNQKTIW